MAILYTHTKWTGLGIIIMDDSGIPSLLSLPFLGLFDKNNVIYQTTRKYILSNWNPYYFTGTAGKGIGGPHEGLGYIWPMALIVQAITSIDDNEIVECLNTIKNSALTGEKNKPGQGYGFIHESFWKDNVSQFTRPWFAWANSLFGHLILTLAKERPHLIFDPQNYYIFPFN